MPPGRETVSMPQHLRKQHLRGHGYQSAPLWAPTFLTSVLTTGIELPFCRWAQPGRKGLHSSRQSLNPQPGPIPGPMEILLGKGLSSGWPWGDSSSWVLEKVA